MKIFILILGTLLIGLAFGKLPETIPIECGKRQCNAWDEYCHHPLKTCYTCNEDMCKLPVMDDGSGMAPECIFKCMEVKRILQREVTKTTSTQAQVKPIPTQESDNHVTTTLYIILAVETSLIIIVPVAVWAWCTYLRRKRKRNRPFEPEMHYSDDEDQETLKLAITNKVDNQNPDLLQ